MTASKSHNVAVQQLLIIARSFGRKPRGKALLGLLLDPEDGQEVPFRLTGQGTWRTRPPTDSPQALRANEVWGVVGLKKYATTDSQRTFWIQVVPYANREDAKDCLLRTLPHVKSGLLVKLSEIKTGPELNLGGYDSMVTRHKIGTISLTSSPVQFQEVAGVIDEYVLIFSFASKLESWTWDDIRSIVKLQGKKIRGRKE